MRSVLWALGVIANLVIGGVAYALAWQIATHLARSRQWPSNSLALAMLGIVLTCSTGHLEHGFHLLTSPAARAVWPPEAVVLDAVTAAGISVYFYFQTGRLAEFARGAAMFEDTAVRRSNALDIHEKIVQPLVAAHYAIERGDLTGARRLLDEGVEATRSVVGELLPPGEMKPGSVRRRVAAPIGGSG